VHKSRGKITLLFNNAKHFFKKNPKNQELSYDVLDLNIQFENLRTLTSVKSYWLFCTWLVDEKEKLKFLVWFFDKILPYTERKTVGK
jgi:hypothetical protein